MLTKTLIYKKAAESLSFDSNTDWTPKNGPTLAVTITNSNVKITIEIPFETLQIMLKEFEVD